MKKIIACALAATVISSVNVITAKALSVKEGALTIEYEQTDNYNDTLPHGVDSAAVITGISGAKGDITLPAIVEDDDMMYSVAAIGDGVFFGTSNITSVELPLTLREIGSTAFAGCLDLEEITIPNTVKSLGVKCFFTCVNLKTVDLGGDDAIIRSIPESCFSNCTSLTKVTIPPTVMTIGKEAFFACPSLTVMEIPKTVKFIGESAVGMSYDIRNDTVVPRSDFLIVGETGSKAESYAKSSGIAFLDPSEYEAGDVNMDGFIDATDASSVLEEYASRSVGGKGTLLPAGKYLADRNGDGLVDASDASEILSEYALRATT